MKPVVYSVKTAACLDNFGGFGGKSANTLKLIKAKIPVPKSVFITADAFSFSLKAILDEFDQGAKKVMGDLAMSREFCASIKNRVIAQSIPEMIANEIKDTLLQEFEPNDWLAIRSSAVGEDGEHQSFAGQAESFLYVRLNDSLDYITRCWASAFSENILHYVQLSGKEFVSPKMGVLVQKMVDAKVSGILFTCDPRKNDRRRTIINAGLGLGEGIVGDLVGADMYIVDNDSGEILDQKIEAKTEMVVFDRDKGYGTAITSSEALLANKPALTTNQIATLHKLAMTAKSEFGCEQDIEWAIDQEGQTVITQARSVTTIQKTIDQTDEFVLDNSNIVESFPGVNTPMTLSIVRTVYRRVFSDALRRVNISLDERPEVQRAVKFLVGSYKGRIFYNLSHWYTFMNLLPLASSYIKNWETMLGVSGVSDDLGAAKVKKPSGFVIAYRLVFLLIFLTPILNRLYRGKASVIDKYWQNYENSPTPSMTKLIESWFYLEEKLFKDWDLTLINDIYAMVFTGICRKFLKSLGLSPEGRIFNDLVQGKGVGRMESVDPLLSINQLAARLRNDPLIRAEVEQLVKIGESDYRKIRFADKAFHDGFHRHIAEYGDRGIGELKLESQTFREYPSTLMQMILDFADHESKRTPPPSSSGAKMVSDALLFHPIKKLAFNIALALAQRSIIYRENFRLQRSKAYGVARNSIRTMGKILLEQGIIAEQDDVFFLEIEEIIHHHFASLYASDKSGEQHIFRRLISERKALYAQWKDATTADRYRVGHLKFEKMTVAQDLSWEQDQDSSSLHGEPCSSGVTSAEAFVVIDLAGLSGDVESMRGKILVSKMTDPGWVFLMNLSGGLIVEKGSILSHTAIIGRELGIPTIVGVRDATKRIKSGNFLSMDGDNGHIKIAKANSNG